MFLPKVHEPRSYFHEPRSNFHQKSMNHAAQLCYTHLMKGNPIVSPTALEDLRLFILEMTQEKTLVIPSGDEVKHTPSRQYIRACDLYRMYVQHYLARSRPTSFVPAPMGTHQFGQALRTLGFTPCHSDGRRIAPILPATPTSQSIPGPSGWSPNSKEAAMQTLRDGLSIDAAREAAQLTRSAETAYEAPLPSESTVRRWAASARVNIPSPFTERAFASAEGRRRKREEEKAKVLWERRSAEPTPERIRARAAFTQKMFEMNAARHHELDPPTPTPQSPHHSTDQP
jgi:hypothetical protein